MPFTNNNQPIAIRDIPLEVYNKALEIYGAPFARSIKEAKEVLTWQEWDYQLPGINKKAFHRWFLLWRNISITKALSVKQQMRDGNKSRNNELIVLRKKRWLDRLFLFCLILSVIVFCFGSKDVAIIIALALLVIQRLGWV